VISRRRFISGSSALAAAAVTASISGCHAALTPRLDAYPFTLGVASGSPLPDGFVLWTRLAPQPSTSNGMPERPVPVRWEVAVDDSFRVIVRGGTTLASPALAHSVHVEVTGLAPGRWYWYRFMCGDAVSPVGRTRTAPEPTQTPPRMRFAFASCQHYEHGYYGAYQHMAKEEVDLVVFLGDYIYEYGARPGRARRHSGGECLTLSDYRNRYALYKSDPDLRRMHATAPWIATWDDHEVQNDYANDRGEDLAPDFLSRRAAAYQAYYEHMPLRRGVLIDGVGSPHLRIYGRHDFGVLARFLMLDDRQYRSSQACPRPGRGGSNTVDADQCPERADAARTMLGAEQENWLFRELQSSGGRWNIIAQQTLMAQLGAEVGGLRRFWTDGWDGYPAARARLLRHIEKHRPVNPIVIGGDVHSNWVCDLKSDFDDERSPAIAAEFCGTSISSPSSWRQERAEDAARKNPHVKFTNTEKRGYTLIDLTPEKLTAHLRVIDDAARPAPSVATLASFVVENGIPGARRL